MKPRTHACICCNSTKNDDYPPILLVYNLKTECEEGLLCTNCLNNYGKMVVYIKQLRKRVEDLEQQLQSNDDIPF